MNVYMCFFKSRKTVQRKRVGQADQFSSVSMNETASKAKIKYTVISSFNKAVNP